MSAFKNHKFSIVRYVREVASTTALKLSIPVPDFADLDAHAQLSELPETDIMGVLNYGCHYQGKFITVHIGLCVMTSNDPGLVRHTELMDALTDAFAYEKVIPVYDANSPIIKPVSYLVVEGDGAVDPMGRENTRSIQVLSVRMKSGQTT